MGLSDGERFNGIMYVINEMTLMKFETPNYFDERFRKLNKLLDSLWPAARGTSSNGVFWILGGESSRQTFSEKSFLGSAFAQQLPIFLNKENDPFDKDEYDDDNRKQWPDITRLLGTGNYTKAYELFYLTEQYFYYANRYNDKFSKSFREVTTIISKIQGILWNEFSRDRLYLKAWLSDLVLKAIFPMFAPKDDIIRVLCDKHYLYHGIDLDNIDNVYLYDEAKEIQAHPRRKLSAQKRVELFFAFLGGHVQYEHTFKSILDIVVEWNQAHTNDRVDPNKVLELCNNSKNIHNKKDSERNYDNGYCYLTHQEIYSTEESTTDETRRESPKNNQKPTSKSATQGSKRKRSTSTKQSRSKSRKTNI